MLLEQLPKSQFVCPGRMKERLTKQTQRGRQLAVQSAVHTVAQSQVIPRADCCH